MDDLPRLLQENEEIRNDFLATILGFMQRHNITINQEDLKGVELTGDVAGFATGGLLPGSGLIDVGGISRTFSPLRTGGAGTVAIVYTTQGDSRSRTFWV